MQMEPKTASSLSDAARLLTAISNDSNLVARLESIFEATLRQLTEGATILLCGNGGSFSQCQHMAAELAGRFLRERRALPAVAIGSNGSLLTATTNDWNNEYGFAREVEAFGKPGDVLWAFSTSGNSANVLRAAEAAGQAGMLRFGFTGERGHRLADLCNETFMVPSLSTPLIQQAHLAAGHYLCGKIEEGVLKSNE